MNKIVFLLEKIDLWLCLNLKPNCLRVRWRELWVRKDEFHTAHNPDLKAVINMNWTRRERHLKRVNEMRRIAHNRDF